MHYLKHQNYQGKNYQGYAVNLSNRWGMLYEHEALALSALAAGLPENALVVNFGAGFGTSALAMLEVRPDLFDTFFTIDISEGGPHGGLQNERNVFDEFGFDRYPHQILMDSALAGQTWDKGLCDLVFVDGDHSASGLTDDILAWRPMVKDGGIMVFHDYERDVWPDVQRVVDKMMKDCSLVLHVDTLYAVRVPAQNKRKKETG